MLGRSLAGHAAAALALALTLALAAPVRAAPFEGPSGDSAAGGADAIPPGSAALAAPATPPPATPPAATAAPATPPPVGPLELGSAKWPRRALIPAYLWDGGALVFVWGALSARLALDTWVSSPSSPRWFPASEGGQPRADWELPSWTVTAAGGALGLGVALGGDAARWYHVKGLAQSLATGALASSGLKLVFGRHRPDYDGDVDSGFGGGARSFPSGHATGAFSVATYAALYLRQRGLVRGRGRALEFAAYVGLGAAATAVGAERVWHHRHHVSDVVAGALLGTATAAAFFAYQEGRARRAPRRASSSFLLGPADRGVGLRAAWRY